MFISYIIIRCKQTGQHEKYEPTIWSDKLKSTRSALTGFIMPIIILGCIYTGIVTPTEAASIAVMYGLIVALAGKRLTWRDIISISIRSSIVSSMLIFILVGAMAIGYMTAILKVPQSVSKAVAASHMPGWSVMVLIMLSVMLLGMFLDGISITLLILPTLYPLIVSLGFNPVWFAVLLTVNFELATMTPPVGMNLYIVHGVTKIPMADVIRGSFPFMILLIVGLIIFAFVPQFSLWLPSVMK
jgi:C4-dicarboxylate transporter DctM subunit